MRFIKGKEKRLKLRREKLLLKIYDFDAFLQSKHVIYGVAF